MKNTKIKRMAADGILCALALIIFIIESYIPPLVAIPGIKIGLANIITVFAIVFLSARDAFLILTVRIFLSALFASQPAMLIYSLCGGIICFAAMMCVKRFIDDKQIWAMSAVGAVFHNAAQIAAAAVITKTAAVFWYLPILTVVGIISGIFTGLCVQYLKIKHGKHFMKILK